MPAARLAFVSLLLFLACGQALAQFGGGMGGMRSGGMGGSRQRQNSDDNSGVTRLSDNDKVRLHLTDLRLALKLRPEQNPLFDAYQARVYDLLGSFDRTSNAADASGLQQIDRKVDQARSRVGMLEEVSSAARKLYAALDDDQKKAADRLLAGTVP